MIELIFIIIVGLILGTWFVLVTAAITIADLRTISLEKAMWRHPHARKWRGVTRTREKLAMYKDGRLLPDKDVRFALARFQADTSMRFVEMIPWQEFPQTVRQFFAVYRTIALSPFVRVRAVLGIRSNRLLWPIIQQKQLVKTRQEKLYGTYVWLLNVTNLSLLLYVSYIALSADQPDFLMAYMTAFGLWLAWSITNHPLLVWRQKLAYLFLAPASFGYFLWRVIVAPLSPIRKIPLLLHPRRVLS